MDCFMISAVHWCVVKWNMTSKLYLFVLQKSCSTIERANNNKYKPFKLLIVSLKLLHLKEINMSISKKTFISHFSLHFIKLI